MTDEELAFRKVVAVHGETIMNLIQLTFELREENKGLKADIENMRCRIVELESFREGISELPALSYGTCE